MVELIGRRDVHDIDSRVVEHRLIALIRRRQAEVARPGRRSLAARTDDSVNLHAEAPQRFDMYHADEPSAHDRSADLGDWLNDLSYSCRKGHTDCFAAYRSGH